MFANISTRTKVAVFSATAIFCLVAFSAHQKFVVDSDKDDNAMLPTIKEYRNNKKEMQMAVLDKASLPSGKLNGKSTGYYLNADLPPAIVPDIPKHKYAANQAAMHKWTFYSQSREDMALYEHYFAPSIRDGVYVEIGALDGVRFSNTKFFEDHQNWKGVLIDAAPNNAAKLVVNRPKSVNVHGAVCKPGVKSIKFAGQSSAGGAVGGDIRFMDEQHKKIFKIDSSKFVEVPCSSMASILESAGVQYVDFFTVDMEGAELVVFETFNWNIPVGVWLIEVFPKEKEKAAAISEVMTKHGYKLADWDLKKYCGAVCIPNQVWIHPNLEKALAKRRLNTSHPPPQRTII